MMPQWSCNCVDQFAKKNLFPHKDPWSFFDSGTQHQNYGQLFSVLIKHVLLCTRTAVQVPVGKWREKTSFIVDLIIT